MDVGLPVGFSIVEGKPRRLNKHWICSKEIKTRKCGSGAGGGGGCGSSVGAGVLSCMCRDNRLLATASRWTTLTRRAVTPTSMRSTRGLVNPLIARVIIMSLLATISALYGLLGRCRGGWSGRRGRWSLNRETHYVIFIVVSRNNEPMSLFLSSQGKSLIEGRKKIHTKYLGT